MNNRVGKNLVWLLCACVAGIAVVVLTRIPESDPGVDRGIGELLDPLPTRPASGDAPLHDAAAPRAGESRSSALSWVKVVNAALDPIEGCEVLAWRDGTREVQQQTTDADGKAAFSLLDGSGGIAAVGPDGARGSLYPMQWGGEHVLVLGGHAVVGGLILVDDAPAPAGLEIALVTQTPLPDSAPTAVTDRLRELRLRESRPGSQSNTGPGGSFSFGGLSPSWRGSLVPPPTHWLAPREGEAWQPERLDLASPNVGLVVSLTKLPLVSGRVVWDSDGTPIAAASVNAVAECGNAIKAGGRTSTALDGTFALGLTPVFGSELAQWSDPRRRPPVQRCSVSCGGVPGSAATVAVDVEGAEALARPIELRVQRAPVMHFLVTDGEGKPIADARVDVKESSPTDRDGRGYFQGSGARLVGAPGYAVVPAHAVGGDGSKDNPLCFVLPRNNKLRIAVTGADPDAARFHEMVIESPVPIMAGRQSWRGFHVEFGGSRCSSGSARRALPDGEVEQRQTLDVTPDADGGALLHSLESGIECVLFVRDQLGSILAESTFSTPQAGVESQVNVTIDKAPRRIRGCVFRPDGSPLPQARVKAVAESQRDRTGVTARSRATTYTAEDGAFRFLAMYTDAPIDLEVYAPGHVKTVRGGLVRANDEQVHEFRLMAGRTVTVHVVDEAGEPVGLFAKPVGFEELEAQSLGPGVWQWTDLPQAVEFYAEVQDRRFSIRHDSDSLNAKLQVPVLARVSVPVSSFPDGRRWKRDDCFVELRHHEHPQQGPVRLAFRDEPDAARYVLPGRYAAEIVVRRARADGTQEFVALGVTSTIDLPRGILTRLTFDGK